MVSFGTKVDPGPTCVFVCALSERDRCIDVHLPESPKWVLFCYCLLTPLSLTLVHYDTPVCATQRYIHTYTHTHTTNIYTKSINSILSTLIAHLLPFPFFLFPPAFSTTTKQCCYSRRGERFSVITSVCVQLHRHT